MPAIIIMIELWNNEPPGTHNFKSRRDHDDERRREYPP